MYQRIMVPVDLAHTDALTRALQTAIDLSRLYRAELVYVGVTAAAPSAAARSLTEYREKLQRFAEEQGEQHGITTQAVVIRTPDPSVELDDRLLKTQKEVDADLVVMASHIPDLADDLHLRHSNAAYLARHSDRSLMIIR